MSTTSSLSSSSSTNQSPVLDAHKANTIKKAARKLEEQTIAWRRDFHAHPELAFEETRTSGIVAEKLKDLGLEVRTQVGKTGVVGVLESGKAGRTVLVRADMDALPIEEARDVPFRSQEKGKMHACGHDGHTAIVMTVAEIFATHKDLWTGNLVFIFQPAEEVVGGAQAMMEDMAKDGTLEGLKVDTSIGLHLGALLPSGEVQVCAGPAMAATDSFLLEITGKGGHAAAPHNSIDPIVIGAQVVMALQTLVSRETDPLGQAVISITSFHGGTAYNIIPESVELKGTLRTFCPDHRQEMKTRIIDTTTTLAQALRGQVTVDWHPGTAAVVNDPAYTELLRRVARDALGTDKVVESLPMMGGDDMSLWLEHAPGCYFFFGANSPYKGTDYPHHHPLFGIDDGALAKAVEVLAKGTLAFLEAGAFLEADVSDIAV